MGSIPPGSTIFPTTRLRLYEAARRQKLLRLLTVFFEEASDWKFHSTTKCFQHVGTPFLATLESQSAERGWKVSVEVTPTAIHEGDAFHNFANGFCVLRATIDANPSPPLEPLSSAGAGSYRESVVARAIYAFAI